MRVGRVGGGRRGGSGHHGRILPQTWPTTKRIWLCRVRGISSVRSHSDCRSLSSLLSPLLASFSLTSFSLFTSFSPPRFFLPSFLTAFSPQFFLTSFSPPSSLVVLITPCLVRRGTSALLALDDSDDEGDFGDQVPSFTSVPLKSTPIRSPQCPLRVLPFVHLSVL